MGIILNCYPIRRNTTFNMIYWDNSRVNPGIIMVKLDCYGNIVLLFLIDWIGETSYRSANICLDIYIYMHWKFLASCYYVYTMLFVYDYYVFMGSKLLFLTLHRWVIVVPLWLQSVVRANISSNFLVILKQTLKNN